MAARRILIIDDDDATVFGYERYLSAEGFSVESSDCLAEGLRKLGSKPFDAVVFDIRLPDGNALDIIPAVRAERVNTKIFVVSGLADAATERTALAAGADDFFVKPLAVNELCAGIAQSFEKGI